MPVIECKGSQPTIRVETCAGRISGIEIDGHRLRGVVGVTIGDGSGTNPPPVFIKVVGSLVFADAGIAEERP